MFVNSVCIERPRKSIEWLEMKVLSPIFLRLWTRVHQIWQARRGVIAVSNAVFRWTISYSRPEIFAIKSRSPRSRQNFDVFGPPIFLGKGPPKFLTQFYKLQSPLNIWQNLVTIGPETSEIRRRKKRKEDRNISSKI